MGAEQFAVTGPSPTQAAVQVTALTRTGFSTGFAFKVLRRAAEELLQPPCGEVARRRHAAPGAYADLLFRVILQEFLLFHNLIDLRVFGCSRQRPAGQAAEGHLPVLGRRKP